MNLAILEFAAFSLQATDALRDPPDDQTQKGLAKRVENTSFCAEDLIQNQIASLVFSGARLTKRSHRDPDFAAARKRLSFDVLSLIVRLSG
jgi:hypothetical protein